MTLARGLFGGSFAVRTKSCLLKSWGWLRHDDSRSKLAELCSDFLWAKVGPQSMLMRSRSLVSHVLHRTPSVQLTLLHQRLFVVLEMYNLSSRDCLPQARCFRRSPWFFLFLWWDWEVLWHLGLCAEKGTCGYLQAESFLPLLLSALLVIQIPLILRCKRELGH